MIRIITDSASDITPKEAEELGIKVLPLSIRFGETEYLDNVTLTAHQFYEKLIETSELPKTSQLNPAKFIEAFDEVDKDDEVICIVMSKKLSGTYNNACIVAEDYKNVYVVDSTVFSIGERLLILQALKYIKEGKLSCKEIVNKLNEEKLNIKLMALLDTLEYLRKGGRISLLTSAVGTILKIKPVAEVVDGKVSMVGKARGSKAGNNMLREKIKEYNGIDFSKPFFLGYAGVSDALLKKYIEDSDDIIQGHPFEYKIIGPAIGTHVGPGAIGVAFFANPKKKNK